MSLSQSLISRSQTQLTQSGAKRRVQGSGAKSPKNKKNNNDSESTKLTSQDSTLNGQSKRDRDGIQVYSKAAQGSSPGEARAKNIPVKTINLDSEEQEVEDSVAEKTKKLPMKAKPQQANPGGKMTVSRIRFEVDRARQFINDLEKNVHQLESEQKQESPPINYEIKQRQNTLGTSGSPNKKKGRNLERPPIIKPELNSSSSMDRIPISDDSVSAADDVGE